MMHQPLIWLAAGALLIVVCLAWWRARSRRLRLRIEHVPSERLDSTPVERQEILGPARVRERRVEPVLSPVAEPSGAAPTPDAAAVEPAAAVADEAPVEDAAAAADPVSEDRPGNDTADAGVAAEAPAEPAAAEAAAPAPVLTQVDLFPEATVPVRLPESGVQALFQGIEMDPVDPTQRKSVETQLPDIDMVLSLHVMARTQAFDGGRLLALLLQYGMRFGDMNIFHRHEFPTGQGMVLFSLAQAMEPGTFNLDIMERDTVPGVSLFMSLPGYKSLAAYDLMVDTARRLAQELGGDLLDQNSQTVTAGQFDTWREQVIEFERKRLMSS